MPVQDDERERELVRIFNLTWDSSHQRSGVDATLDVVLNGSTYRLDVEVKSTTGNTVATARDVGMGHINRWRTMFFVIGFYSREARRPELQRCLCLTPIDMEPWIASVESKILIDYRLAARASHNLTPTDLFEVVGEQATYSIEDAKRLHKQQWTAAQYEQALDTEENGIPRISQARMLEILQLRARYIAERGATLNNPHITSTHLQPFLTSNRLVQNNGWAAQIRQLAQEFVREHPDHPAIVRVDSTE